MERINDAKPTSEDKKAMIIAYFTSEKKGYKMDRFGILRKTMGKHEYRIKLQDISFRLEEALRSSETGEMIKWMHIGGGYYSEFDVVDGKLVRKEKCKVVKKEDRQKVMDRAVERFGEAVGTCVPKEKTPKGVLTREQVDAIIFQKDQISKICESFKEVLGEPESDKETRLNGIVDEICKKDKVTFKELSESFIKMQETRDEGTDRRK